MKTFYKGNFILQNDIPRKITFKLIKEKTLHINMKITGSKYKFKDDEKNELIEFILEDGCARRTSISTNINLINNIINLISNLAKKSSKISILYEKIFDKNGNPYAKELITGLVFPLFSKEDFNSYFEFSYETDEKENKDNYIKTGYFEIYPDLREFLYSCDLYCIEDEIACETEINYYLNHYRNEKFKNKIKKLYNMNIFDKIIFNQNDNSSTNIPNNSMNNITSLNSSISTESQHNSISNTNNSDNSINQNNNMSSLFTIDIQLKWLERFKQLINSLTEEDKNQLNDMTYNNLDNENILKYILMSKEERLEFLKQINNDNRPKVSLKKK